MLTRAYHEKRFLRMLQDLDIVPAALMRREGDSAVVDGVLGRVVTPALDNRTLAEGLISAIKLAAANIEERGR